MNGPCKEEGCERPWVARDMCNSHIALFYRRRSRSQSKKPLEAVPCTGGCGTIVSIWNLDPERRCFKCQGDVTMTVAEALML
jgi:hypothetical protein